MHPWFRVDGLVPDWPDLVVGIRCAASVAKTGRAKRVLPPCPAKLPGQRLTAIAADALVVCTWHLCKEWCRGRAEESRAAKDARVADVLPDEADTSRCRSAMAVPGRRSPSWSWSTCRVRRRSGLHGCSNTRRQAGSTAMTPTRSHKRRQCLQCWRAFQDQSRISRRVTWTSFSTRACKGRSRPVIRWRWETSRVPRHRVDPSTEPRLFPSPGRRRSASGRRPGYTVSATALSRVRGGARRPRGSTGPTADAPGLRWRRRRRPPPRRSAH